MSDRTPAEFSEWCNSPFILTDPVKGWPIYKTWSIDYLREHYGKTSFRAEAVDWPLRVYLEYMEQNNDESPLYLFDRGFVEKMSLNSNDTADYSLPECFQEDMFEVLGSHRPDHRWLIVGPEGSGSTFHKDPNATSAWNAAIRGAKYWIMFPSLDNASPPPGVFVSEDQAEVTSPLSIAEWLLAYHAEARNTKGCLEGVCYDGEVLHVPSGWWHLVVNLTPAIAITQNFVPRAHLPAVLRFLRDKPEQVSGFSKEVEDPYQLFVQRMEERYPNILDEGLAAAKDTKKKRRWDEVASQVETNETSNGGFAFGFGDDDLESESMTP
ncbi:MAG: hypothetical protein M1823_001803 [Watsoniomyces obsoletus]|nr:MAG: hypothetical protein M1823_001803 [Watsoniomyces obsoletus]